MNYGLTLYFCLCIIQYRVSTREGGVEGSEIDMGWGGQERGRSEGPLWIKGEDHPYFSHKSDILTYGHPRLLLLASCTQPYHWPQKIPCLVDRTDPNWQERNRTLGLNYPSCGGLDSTERVSSRLWGKRLLDSFSKGGGNISIIRKPR